MTSLADVTLGHIVDLIAEAVVARLEARPLERDFGTPQEKFDQNLEVANNAAASVPEPSGLDEFVPATPPVKPQINLANSSKDKRVAELAKETIVSLRKLIAAAENKMSSDYTTMKKPALVNYIADFEALTGHRVDEVPEDEAEPEVPDDTSVESEPEDDADEEVDLDRDSAIALGANDLGELKSIAIDAGVDAADLKGLDVHAIVDLLFGSEDDEDAAEEPASAEADESEDEEAVVSLEDIPALLPEMSLAELKELADQLEVEYTRKDTLDTLSEKITVAVDAALEEE
jgi:hypothetical protein